jgi:hypothetical protein
MLATDALAFGWTANRSLTGGGVGYAWRGALAASSSTLVHAVDQQVILGWTGVYYRRSTDSGSTWSTPIRLSQPQIGDATAASIDAYGDSVDAVWLESDQTLAGLDTVVMYRRSIDGGVTWLDPIRVSPGTESAGPPRVARRGALVVVTWTNQRSGAIYANRSTDGGARFSGRVSLGSTSSRSSGLYEAWPAVAIGTGVVYVTYFASPKKLRIRRSTTSGATWKPAVTLATNGSGYQPSVAASGSTVIVGYAAMNSARTDAWAVTRRSTDKGASWRGVVALSTASSTPSFSPVVSVRGSRWMAIYDRCTTSRCSNSDVFYRASTSGGRTWSSPLKASVRTRRHGEPCDVERATKTLVMYVDWDSKGSDVYVRQGS